MQQEAALQGQTVLRSLQPVVGRAILGLHSAEERAAPLHIFFPDRRKKNIRVGMCQFSRIPMTCFNVSFMLLLGALRSYFCNSPRLFIQIFNAQEVLYVLNYRDSKIFLLDLKIRFNMYSFKLVQINSATLLQRSSQELLSQLFAFIYFNI